MGKDRSAAVLVGQGADPIIGNAILVCDLWWEHLYRECDLLDVLERWAARYNVQKILVEQFASSGIVEGCLRRGLPVETIAPTPQNQAAAFTRLYTLAKENRLVFPVGASVLIEELGILRHSIGDTGVPRFSAPSGRHDDCAFALAWATHALASVAPMDLHFVGAGAPTRPDGMSRVEFREKQERENAVKLRREIAAAEAEKGREWQEEQQQRADDFVYRVRREGCVFPRDV